MRLLFVENHAVFARTVAEEFLTSFRVVIAPSLKDARRHLATGPFEVMRICGSLLL